MFRVSKMGQILNAFVKDYDYFLREYITQTIPYFVFLGIWVLGIMILLNQALLGIVMPDGITVIDSWNTIWLIAIFLGPFPGFLAYFLGGFIYQLLVSLSGGEWSLFVTRRANLFAMLPIYIITITISLFYTLVYGQKALVTTVNPYVVLWWSIVVFIISIIAFIRSYRTAIILLKAKSIRAFIFFLLIPLLISFITLGGTAMQAFGLTEGKSYTSQGLLLSPIMHEELQEAQFGIDNGELEKSKEIYLKIINASDQTISKDELMEAYINLASIYGNEGDFDSVKFYTNEALEKADKNSEAYHLLMGLLAMANHDTKSLANAFIEVLKINPDNAEANAGLGRYYMTEKMDYEKALPYNETAFKHKKTITGLEVLALNYYLLQNYYKAQSHFEELHKIAPNNTTALIKLGEIAYGFGDKEGAKQYFMKLEKLDPTKITSEVQALLNED